MPDRYLSPADVADDVDAVPGTMLVSLRGSLAGLARPDEAGRDHDHFSLFVVRSDALGWSDDGGHAGAWAMNDASGMRVGAGIRCDGEIARFQVDAAPVPTGRTLPTQSFLRCAWEVCEQFGDIEVEEVLLLLPIQRFAPRRIGATASARTASWFEGAGPRARASFVLDVAAGSDSGAVAPHGHLDAALEDLVGLLDAAPTVVSGAARRPPDAIDAPFDDDFWKGPAVAAGAVGGEIVAWSPDAIGWLAGALAECVAARGVRVPLLARLRSTQGSRSTT